MGLFDNLKEAQRSATGAAGAAIGSLLSLPVAGIVGLGAAVQGKSFDDASAKVMETFAGVGMYIGREASDDILRTQIRMRSSGVASR